MISDLLLFCFHKIFAVIYLHSSSAFLSSYYNIHLLTKKKEEKLEKGIVKDNRKMFVPYCIFISGMKRSFILKEPRSYDLK